MLAVAEELKKKKSKVSKLLLKITTKSHIDISLFGKLTIICYLTKGKLFLGLELPAHVAVIAHTDGQKPKAGSQWQWDGYIWEPWNRKIFCQILQ